LIVFFSIFISLNTIGQELIGKRSGSFGDSGYCEVQNNYMIEWIDTWNNATLTDGNRTIAVNSKSFSESFKFFIYNDLIVVKKSTIPHKLLIINTLKRVEELKTEEWLVKKKRGVNFSDIFVTFKYQDKSYVFKIDDCVMIKGSWYINDELKWHGELNSAMEKALRL